MYTTVVWFMLLILLVHIADKARQGKVAKYELRWEKGEEGRERVTQSFCLSLRAFL